jgi:hypothetical protein
LQLLGSEGYVREKLESLNGKQIGELKVVFIANKHPRFKKVIAASRHEPFGKTSDYVKYIQNADSHKLGKLIKILAMLSQTKVYLFWKAIYK